MEQSYLLTLLSELGTWTTYVDDAPGTAQQRRCFVKGRNPAKTLRRARKELARSQTASTDYGTRDEAARAVLEARGVRDHIIPLLAEHGDSDADMVQEATKLLVLLTMPEAPLGRAIASETRQALKARPHVLGLLVAQVEGPLSKEAAKRTDKDKLTIEFVLWLLRNLLASRGSSVAAAQAASRSAAPENAIPELEEDAESTLAAHEFVLLLDQQLALELVLHLAQHVDRKTNRDWTLVLLEIFFHALRGVRPEHLLASYTPTAEVMEPQEESRHAARTVTSPVRASSNLNPNTTSTYFSNSNDSELSRLRKEQMARRQRSLRAAPSRHSRFGGIIQVASDSGERKRVSNMFALDKASAAYDLSTSGAGTAPPVTRSIPLDPSPLPFRILRGRDLPLSPTVRTVLRTLVERLCIDSYANLFDALIHDFRRETASVTPQDEVLFLWLAHFCTRYSRLSGLLPQWSKSPLMTTMDLWSFSFVVNKIYSHNATKARASLETSIASLLEMMLVIRDIRSKEPDLGRTLQNAVYYKMHERLDIVARIIKEWQPEFASRLMLRDALEVADQILEVVEDMDREGAMALAKSKAAKKAERQAAKAQKKSGEGEPWSAEETLALYEGVMTHGSDSTALKLILQDPQLGPVFEDQGRSTSQLAARWLRVQEATVKGQKLEDFCREDLEKEAQKPEESKPIQGEEGEGDGTKNDDKDEGEQEDNEEGEKKPEDAVLERRVDFVASLRPYLSNMVLCNVLRLVDPARDEADGERGVYMTPTERDRACSLAAAFLHRVRAFQRGLRLGESLEPMLWHVENFAVMERLLLDETAVLARAGGAESALGVKELFSVIRSTLRRFMRHAVFNPLAFVEALFWRTKAETLEISRLYQDPQSRRGRHHYLTDGPEVAAAAMAADGEDELDLNAAASGGEEQELADQPVEEELDRDHANSDEDDDGSEYQMDVELGLLSSELEGEGPSLGGEGKDWVGWKPNSFGGAPRFDLDSGRVRRAVARLMDEPDGADVVTWVRDILESVAELRLYGMSESMDGVEISGEEATQVEFPILSTTARQRAWLVRADVARFLLTVGWWPRASNLVGAFPTKTWAVRAGLSAALLGSCVEAVGSAVFEAGEGEKGFGKEEEEEATLDFTWCVEPWKITQQNASASEQVVVEQPGSGSVQQRQSSHMDSDLGGIQSDAEESSRKQSVPQEEGEDAELNASKPRSTSKPKRTRDGSTRKPRSVKRTKIASRGIKVADADNDDDDEINGQEKGGEEEEERREEARRHRRLVLAESDDEDTMGMEVEKRQEIEELKASALNVEGSAQKQGPGRRANVIDSDDED